MASTYSTNIRAIKQGDGENPNSWGDLLNTNVDLYDEAIAGYVTVTVSSVDVTLTNSNGASDQSRHAFLYLTGTVTDSLDIIIPAATKGYVIHNAATVSAGTSINIKTAAGSGANTSQSSINMYVCDSVSVVELNSGMGTAAALNIGTSVNELTPVSIADVRYVTASATQTVTGGKTYTGTAGFTGDVTVSGAVGFTSAVTYTGAPQIDTVVCLTDATTIALDLSLGSHFAVTLGGNRTIPYPDNPVNGMVGKIYVHQDGTGTRTLSLNDSWKFPSGTAPTLTTSINSVDLLVYSVRDTSLIDTVIVKDFKRT